MVTSRSFRLHATHTTKTVAFTGYISLRSASAAVRGAMPQMVPAVTRSANSSLAEAYSGFSTCVHRRKEHPTAGIRSA
jgi:hypothetical protein